MQDWGPVFVSVVLFILLTPGLLVQIPGRNRIVEFGNFQTSGLSILVHSVLYFGLICIFLLAIRIHILNFFSSEMADWAPVIIGVVLFVLLQPGLLFSFPGNGKQLEFGGMKTNGKAIFIHTLIFFALYAILILAVHVHIYTG
ncbi:uncharacterized protein LOC133298805 isoform X1 [Gastrolobium bilobum]|uniref:uncharacterized protein LOC133298805 isoform X1 n=1 Tax=Gastrolobium bilobum TaxID=150636 RepID=UPI002AB17E2B|nr:uncharacterized protein LOC133298805 isoform X1 [Gastrolobium bilobum]